MPHPVHPLVLKGRQALQAGDASGALSLCEMRLNEQPDDAMALELKAVIAKSRGDLRGAEAVLRQAIRFDPASEWALNDLTELLYRTGQKTAAETAAREALLARPDDAQAHLQFAVILGEKDDLPAAEFHNRRALALAGPHPQILVNLALTLVNQGRTDEAEPLLLDASKAQPDVAIIMAHLSKLYEARRDMAKALLWLDRAEATGRRTGEDFTLLRALYLANADKPQQSLDLIDAQGDGLAAPARLERAKLLDKLGRHDEAWSGFVDAKTQLAKDIGVGYDAARFEADYAAMAGFFTRDRMQRLPPATRRTDTSQPIFILGFPRSGTTMIEQMLNSHPDVNAGGELPFVHEWPALIRDTLPGAQPFPHCLGQAQTADFHHVSGLLRDYYLGRAKTYGVLDARPFFTDKMPLNDVYLPLIRLAFPEATVIRMVRHPLDVAMSMLSHNLTHGENSGFAMATIIRHMRAVHALTEAYDAALGPVFTLKYEDFVADQEAQTRRVLDHAGLAFDVRCLWFHENKRHAPTPSYAQVSKPLNDRSIGRWKPYARHLAPFMDEIAPVIEALGYSL